MSEQNPIDGALQRLQAAVDAAKPAILPQMGAIAVQFVHENFEKEGFQGEVFEPWLPRKEETRKTKGKQILTDTAQLRNATRYDIISADAIRLSNMMPYAAIHNYGGSINMPARTQVLSFNRTRSGGLRLGRTATKRQRNSIVAQAKANIGAYTLQMPQRRFIGDSPVLNTRIAQMVVRNINNRMKRM